MIYLIVIIIISFFLESFFSLFITLNSYFLPLFTLISLVLTYPYFRKYHHSFYKVSLVIGVMYDVIYTNTVFLHALLFVLIAYILVFLYRYFEYQYLNLLLMMAIVILIYRISSFCFLFLIGKVAFSYSMLFHSIFGSFISNLIYGSLLYLLLNFLKKEKQIQFYH